MGSYLSSVKYTPDGIPYHKLSDFNYTERVGAGQYGIVKKGYGTIVTKWAKERREVAIKEFNYPEDISAEREIGILKKQFHPNIIELFGVIWEGKTVTIADSFEKPIYTGYVMEFMHLGSLHDDYDTKLIITWIYQTAEGLKYLHNNGIIHRDVKPKNILLAARDHLKLADFGLARVVSTQNTNTSGPIGTDIYRAPEVLISSDYGPPADVYSLGVTIWEIIYRKHPWEYLDHQGNILVDLPLEPNGMEEMNRITNLMKRCLQLNAIARPSIDEITRFEPELFQTILLIKGVFSSENTIGMVLNRDRTKWINLDLKAPCHTFGVEAVYLNDEIYLFGRKEPYELSCPKHLYKLDKYFKWIPLADMNVGREWIRGGCLVLNGHIWVIGGEGCDHNKPIKNVERYDPKKNKWTTMPDMNIPRRDAAVALWNGNIIVCGGDNGNGRTNTVECFNPKDGFWTMLCNIPTPLSSHCLLSHENELIVIGGFDGETCDKVWKLDLSESPPNWKPLPPLNSSSYFLAGTVFDNEVYVIGGYQSFFKELNRVEIFDGKNWRNGPSLPYSMYAMSAVIIPHYFSDRLRLYKPRTTML